MKRAALSVYLLCLSAFFFAVNALNALTIPASEDSYTAPRNTLSYSTNNANSLIVDATRKSYLYFDLSDIPPDAVVRWAKLRLFLPTVRTPGAGLSVHLVTGTWNESTRLADVPSVLAGSLGMIAPSKMASRRFVTVDVKDTVQKWINGGTLNEGFAIQPIVKAGSPTASVMLTSKEGPVFGLPAELDIEFQPEGGVNKPVALDQLPSAIQSLLIPTPPTLTSESQLPQSVRSLLGSLSSAFTPKITSQPSLSGGLLVSAENSLDPQIKYQWLRNGLPISTGTESSLRRAGLAGGTYQVRASNTVSGTNSVSVVIPDNGHEVVFVPNTGVLFSKYETTVGQWKAFVEETGWNKSDAWKNPVNLRTQSQMSQTEFEPVVCINASDATEYCAWLSQKTGKLWRLPTAEEWGACIGSRLYPWGDYYPPLSTDGNFYGLSTENDGFQNTAPVGSYSPKASASIYDLSGNVWEWVVAETAPLGFALKGGAYDNDEAQVSILQSGISHSEDSNVRHPAIGFRVVRDWLNEGLVAYYPFNGNATDHSGNALNGSIQGSPSVGTDRFGGRSGYTYPTAGDVVILPIDHSKFETDFTISVWVLPTGRNHDYAQILSGENSFLQLHLYGPVYDSNGSGEFGKVVFYQYNKSLDRYYRTLNSQNQIGVGGWSHILVTVSGDQSRFYLNGVLKDSGSQSFEFAGVTGNSLYLGGNLGYADAENFRWEGAIDDVRIYNRALSEREVKALYSMEKPETISTYEVIVGNFTWQEAKADAELRGGHLATITSPEEWSTIRKQTGGEFYRSLWLGASASNSGGFEWVTGEAFEIFDSSLWTSPDNSSQYPDRFLRTWGDDRGWDDVSYGFATEGYLLEVETNASDFVPTITAQPSTAGDLSVTASGANLQYQWSRNGVSVSGGTAAVLRRAGLSGGTYQVRVSNAVSGTNSVSVVIPDNGHEVVQVPDTNVMFSKYETTVGQWKAFVEETGWNKSDAWKSPTHGILLPAQTDSESVVCISKGYAEEYCAWLSQKTGYQYRLPSDFEWSKAANLSKYPWGENFPPDSSSGNFSPGYHYGGFLDSRIDGYAFTSPVGMFSPNPYGIYDLGGNAWEWTSSDSGIIRGASWENFDADLMKSGTLTLHDPNDLHPAVGFRVVREIPELIKVEGGTLPASSQLGAVPVETFYIGRTEVTWGEWQGVRTWAVSNGYTDLDGVGQGVGDNYPVTDVNWYDVVKWCNARSQKEGKTPVYKNGTDVYKTGEVTPTEVASANGYRLPSEKEWEFAARGGTQTQGYTYSGSNDLNAVGWYSENSGFVVHEVGKKLANELGIYDMSGNVWEWSGSWYPGYEGSSRVFRGGNWNYYGGAEGCTVAYRWEGAPTYRYHSYGYGFRVATSGEYALGITVQPSVSLDGTKLSVEAAGAGTLTYQWRINGVAIAGGTSSQLSTQGLQSGTYTVVVSNGFASVTSTAIQYIPSPIGTFALVTGGTLPASSPLGAVPVDTFYIGKTEVTWGEWQAVRTWAVANGYTDLDGVGQGVGDNYPVTDVNWYDVVKWCNARSEKEGKTPVYKNGTAVYRTGNVSEPAIVASANGYRLPSEAEWEFAARGGTQTQGYTYSGSNDLNAVGWYGGNSGGAVKEVGKKQANELGIYDMSGNLWEWSGSWYPGLEGSYRVFRGGNWYFNAEDCTVADRDYDFPESRSDRVGFRVALSSVPEMVLVSGGTLPASSLLGAVSVDTFYIGKTEVTWGEWQTVRTWAVANGYTDLANVGQGVGDSYPVTSVNWFDVVKWCNARSEKEGKIPVYKNGANVYRTGKVLEPAIVASANGYRLPSEKEWEFAARGGTQTNGYTYSGSNDLDAVGWWYGNAGGVVHEVGKKLANELGIFDMSGNVWEWSASWLPGSSYRVIRGGAWDGNAEYCSVADRSGSNPELRVNFLGFRVALSSVP